MSKNITWDHLFEDRKKSDEFFDVPNMKRKSSSVGSMPKKFCKLKKVE